MSRDYVGLALDYARQVTAGELEACEFVKLACKRQIEDLKRAETGALAYRFDPERASRPCKFLELLPHIKGPLAGQKIRLEPWQIFIVSTVYGWIDEAGARRFRIVYIEVPRKNAKSTISAGLCLYALGLDEEDGAEVYTAATSRDQSKIVFEIARQMARREPQYRSRCGVSIQAHRLNQGETASFMAPLSAESGSLEGLNVHFACIDELHAHKNRGVYDVLENATAARAQPLIWNITTAGSNRAGICYEQRTYAARVLRGAHVDETYFGIIYTIDARDDWTRPEAWRKANPNYGVSVRADDMKRLATKATELVSAQNNFLTKRLNVWVNAATAWLDMNRWQACADPTMIREEFRGRPCKIALDLSSKIDIASKIVLFEDGETLSIFDRHYLPEETVRTSSNAQYSGWAREGRLIVTPGSRIDFERIKADILKDAEDFLVEEIIVDPWQATHLSTQLLDEGFEVVELRAIVQNYSEPMKEIEARVRDHKIRHDGSPILDWMISNVVAHLDAKDNIYPRKEYPENKIDGLVALIMAVNRVIFAEPQPPASIYTAEGMVL